jgi:hypothetical protein
VHTARWVYCEDEKHLDEFRVKAFDNLAVDHSGALVYLAPSRVNLELTSNGGRRLRSAPRENRSKRTPSSRAILLCQGLGTVPILRQ